MSIELPEEVVIDVVRGKVVTGYTRAQLLAYGEAVKEACAKVAERTTQDCQDRLYVFSDEAAAAIRALDLTPAKP